MRTQELPAEYRTVVLTSHLVKPTSIVYFKTFTVNPIDVKKITYQPLVHPNGSIADGYEATLSDGNQVTGFHFKIGPCEKEIWTLFWPVLVFEGEEERGDPIPIPQRNYLILKSIYEKKNNHD